MAIPEITAKTTGKADADRREARQVRTRRNLHLAKWYAVGLVILSVMSVPVFIYSLVTTAAYPYELGYAEGITLWQAQHVNHPVMAYGPINRFPYIVFEYPPLYHFFSLALSSLTGDLLQAGRIISMLSTLGLCLTLGWTVYRLTPARVPRYAAVAGAAFAFALPWSLDAVRKFAPLMKVDMLGMWLTFSGIAVYVLAQRSVWRYAAFALFVAGMYTKQTLVCAAVACLLVGALVKAREATRLAVFTMLLGGSVLAILSLATRGEVIKHLFVYNVNRYSLRWAVAAISANVESTLPLLTIGIAAAWRPMVLIGRALRRGSLNPLRAWLTGNTYRLAVFTLTVYLVLSGVLLLSAGKSGADTNYFLEWDLGLCLLSSMFVGQLLWPQNQMRRSSVQLVAYILPVLILVQQMLLGTRIIARRDADRQMMARYAEGSRQLEETLRRSPEPVMSEDMTLLYKAGKNLPFEPNILAELAALGTWDEAPLVRLIRQQTFSVMIISDLRSSRYSPPVSQAIAASYRPTESYMSYTLGQDGRFTVYVPRQ